MSYCGIFAIHRKEVRAKVKYAVIYRYKERYPLLVMCKFFSVSRSGYYSFVKRMSHPETDATLAETITAVTCKVLSYLRLPADAAVAKKSKRIYHNSKTILRVMQKTACWQRFSAAGSGSR